MNKLQDPNVNKMIVMKFAANALFYWGLVVTVILVIGMFADFKDEGFNTNLILGTGIIGVLPLILGYYLKKNIKNKVHSQSKPKDSYDETERKLLLAAKRHSGILNISQASLAINKNLKDTKSIMDDLASSGFCNVDVNESGVVEYHFRAFLKDEE